MNYLRLYDENLDMVCEMESDKATKDRQIKNLLDKSELFLKVDNLYCYRLINVSL